MNYQYVYYISKKNKSIILLNLLFIISCNNTDSFLEDTKVFENNSNFCKITTTSPFENYKINCEDSYSGANCPTGKTCMSLSSFLGGNLSTISALENPSIMFYGEGQMNAYNMISGTAEQFSLGGGEDLANPYFFSGIDGFMNIDDVLWIRSMFQANINAIQNAGKTIKAIHLYYVIYLGTKESTRTSSKYIKMSVKYN